MARIRLVWARDREEHIARHGVSLEETIEVVNSRHFRRRVSGDRYRIIGQTEAGRLLTIFVGHRVGVIFGLITARAANHSERREWERNRFRRTR